ncbi:MAG: phage portal protein [Bacteroidales bacterium]|nr:phage portal protein [Bacteroidales bacterium]
MIDMTWFNREKKEKTTQTEERCSTFDSLMYNCGASYSTNKAMLLSTVYRCVEVISDSVAQLPLELYRIDSNGYKMKFTKHPTYRLLNSEPNSKMTRFTFIKTLIVSTLLKGNGFAYIERDNEGNATAMHYIPSELVTIIPPKTLGDAVAYTVGIV